MDFLEISAQTVTTALLMTGSTLRLILRWWLFTPHFSWGWIFAEIVVYCLLSLQWDICAHSLEVIFYFSQSDCECRLACRLVFVVASVEWSLIDSDLFGLCESESIEPSISSTGIWRGRATVQLLCLPGSPRMTPLSLHILHRVAPKPKWHVLAIAFAQSRLDEHHSFLLEFSLGFQMRLKVFELASRQCLDLGMQFYSRCSFLGWNSSNSEIVEIWLPLVVYSAD